MHLSLSSGGTYSEWSIRPSAMGDKRKTRKRKNSGSDPAEFPTRTLKQYSIDEKLEIIDFAKDNGNRAAGREYNVAESSIREWRKNEAKLRTLNETEPDRSRLSGGGRRLQEQQNRGGAGDDGDSSLLQVPLSLMLPSGSIDVSENNDQEASLGAASNASTHSSSPTLSISSVNGCNLATGSSSRRKTTQPKKIIYHEVVAEVAECV